MKRLLHKRITRKGFTLAELLIVVAIIAILVAVSIPIFTSQLDKARKSTDEANLRACKSLVVNALLTEDFLNTQWDNNPSFASSIYDAGNGCLVPASKISEVKGYGQGSGATGYTNSENEYKKAAADLTAGKGAYLYVTVEKNKGEFLIQWYSG